MNEDPNSPKKPVPKADIPHRSITSTTTEETSKVDPRNLEDSGDLEASEEQQPDDFPNLPRPSKTQGVPPNEQKTREMDHETEEQQPETSGENNQSRDCKGAGSEQAPSPLHNCRGSDPQILDDHQQFLFLELLSKGGSPQAVCLHLGMSFDVLQRTLDRDPTFRARREQVEQLLSQNVAAALYRAAMEGNVTAQTHWLRNNPPEHWRENKNELPENLQDMERLSDDDLKRLAIFFGEAIPEELA